MNDIACLDRDGIAALIPHSGNMCLLARLASWDAQRISCVATNHRDADHPLRTASGLMSPCAIEYAAQAMALHRAFGDGDAAGRTGDANAARGMLASVRAVTCHVARLDDVEGELTIEAARISGDGNVVVYAFEVKSGARALVTGRASAVLDLQSLGTAR